MKERPWPVMIVSDRAEKRLRGGHPWVYDNEIEEEPFCEGGALADVRSRKGKYIGTGFYNAASKIRVRILSANANDTFDDAFFIRRVGYALDYRKTVMREDFSACRLIFGEADGLPGLTVDRFGDLISVQTACLGTDLKKEVILDALLARLSEMGEEIRGVYLRGDLPSRKLEGLPQESGWYKYFGEGEPDPTVIITENGIRYKVDVSEGQKTGFFLDQKYNRREAARIAPGRTVLDCCTHIGSFALNCAAAGAAHVTALDVSAAAVEQVKENAARNGLSEKVDAVCADVFDYLKGLLAAHDKTYDYVILDPPAFTKARKTLDHAYQGYKEINTLAMRLLPRGGYLATCSCSQFMTEELFARMLSEAAQDAGVKLKIVSVRHQAPDHPYLLHVPETKYLKFFLVQTV